MLAAITVPAWGTRFSHSGVNAAMKFVAAFSRILRGDHEAAKNSFQMFPGLRLAGGNILFV
jgi:hypothetical protein